MRPLIALSIANTKSFIRDRSALFWTFAFPILFVVLFGSLFSGRGPSRFDVGWVDQDASQASGQLRAGFESTGLMSLQDLDEQAGLDKMRSGDLAAVIVVPAGFGQAVAASTAGTPAGGPLQLTVYTDPSQATQSTTIQQIVGQMVGATNQVVSGKPPVLVMVPAPIQTQQIGAAAYFVPSILAMALMQLGIFSAIPLVQQREKLILKRLAATPLRRWTLVGSNIVMRLGIAVIQTVLIVGLGIALFGVTLLGSTFLVAGFIVLGAVAFIAIGYAIASYAKTTESANSMTSIVQFPMMFLSGIFFPIAFMPAFLQPIAALLPLTYLGDALRQVMVGGVPYAPLAVDAAVLAGWLVACFLFSAKYFRWQ